MGFREWTRGEQVLADTESHWFAPDLLVERNGSILVIAPYTTQYGNGAPPWTVTLATAGTSGALASVATYATGFDFQTAAVNWSGDDEAIFWTSANGTYPASDAVDLNARLVDASGNPVGAPVTLLSDVNDLEQFRVGTEAEADGSALVAYSTYDAATRSEQVHVRGFAADGTPIAGENNLIESFTTAQSYDAFGFGTLTPAGAADPSFIYLRKVDGAAGQELGFQTIGTDGVATGAFTGIDLAYSEGSTDRRLGNWVWSRLDAPSDTGNNLVTVSQISDVSDDGFPESFIDVQVKNTAGGERTDDVFAWSGFSSDELAITSLANGGFVIGYTEVGYTYLRQYDNSGDLVSSGSIDQTFNVANLRLDTLSDGRVVTAYTTNGGQSLVYDVYTATAGPITYNVGEGVTRSGIVLKAYDYMNVEAGGAAVGTVVKSGAGDLIVRSGGTTRGTVVNGSFETVFADGTTQGTRVNADGIQFVEVGGTATGTIINGGSQQTTGTTVGTLVNRGAYQFVEQHGDDQEAIVRQGGTQWTSGRETGTIIRGGDQLLEEGASSTGATVDGGDQDVTSGAAAFDTIVNGGTQYAQGGAIVSETTVNHGGTLDVLLDGLAQSAVIHTGGIADIAGDATGLQLDDGTLVVGAGAVRLVGAASSKIFDITQTSAAAALDLGSGMLSVRGAAQFSPLSGGEAPLATGASGATLVLAGTTTVRALAVGGSALLRVTGTLKQTGAVTLGDASNGDARITVAAGAQWSIAAATGIVAGSTAASIDVAGTLVKTAGTAARSVIAPRLTNTTAGTGTVEVAAGTLELAGTLSGRLAVKADVGTTLILDKAAAGTVAASFGGANATLQLNEAQGFHGTIAGFGAGENLDLHAIRDTAGAAPTLLYSGDTSSGTLTVSDGTRTAHLALLGDYGAAGFHLGSDGHGGTLVTYG